MVHADKNLLTATTKPEFHLNLSFNLRILLVPDLISLMKLNNKRSLKHKLSSNLPPKFF